MKKSIIIFSALLILLFSVNTTCVFAEPKTFKQGIYSVRDTGLIVGTQIDIKLTSSNDRAIIMVIDSDQTIESLVRLNPTVTKQTLPPLKYDSSIVIFTNGSVIFS